MKRITIILLFPAACFAQNNHLDSIKAALKGHPLRDTVRAIMLSNLSSDLQDVGDFSLALRLGKEALEISDSLNYKHGIQSSYNNLGNSYIDMGEYKTALEYHLKALKIREEIGDKKRIAYSYLNIGNIYFRLGDNEKSLENYQHCLKILLQTTDTQRVATCYSNIASIYSGMNKYEEAEKYIFKALGIRKRIDDKDGMAESYSNLGVMRMDKGRYNEALEYAQKALDIWTDTQNKLSQAIALSNIGEIYFHLNDLDNSVRYQQQAVDLAKEMKSIYMLETGYKLLAEAHRAKGDHEKAVKNFQLYIAAHDSILNEENARSITEMQTRFETDKKEKEISLLQKDKSINELRISEQQANIRQQQIAIYSSYGGVTLALALTFFIWRGLMEKKRINLSLEEKNTAISSQRDEIEEKNLLITDSIDYARSIQDAILPHDDLIRKLIPHSFIFYFPKEIVSGDFYWMKETGDRVLVAAIDCTGHGVPGAFMSVMAYNMLENIIREKKITRPSLILDELNKAVVETLHQDVAHASAKYGMDIALIVVDKRMDALEFSGAHNSLLVARGGKLLQVKADSMPIGDAREKFTNHRVELQAGDMLYMYTDGYADQFGEKKHEKFFSTRFRDLLTGIAGKSSEEQKQALGENFFEWKGEKEQVDDILVIGIRV